MDSLVGWIAAAAALVAAGFSLWSFLRHRSGQDPTASRLDAAIGAARSDLGAVRATVESVQRSIDDTRRELQGSLSEGHREQQRLMDTRLEAVDRTLSDRLNEIRGVVDDKLSTTLTVKLKENFTAISTLLSSVQSGLGQIQSLANDVSGLRRSIDGVKTRGVFGEVMLRALLEEFLQHSQFVEDFRPSRHSKERVEFAIKLPGRHPEDDSKPIYLPIDAKFPKESYDRLLNALEAGDAELAKGARNELSAAIWKAATDISEKYIRPPSDDGDEGTTDFAVLYLPFESLFAEVARIPGLLEEIRRDLKVTIASPTTLAALLSALRVGFRTLEVQRDHAKLGTLLGAVRTIFEEFSVHLQKVDDRLQSTRKAIAEVQKKAAKMQRKLHPIRSASEPEATRLLELDQGDGDAEQADELPPGDDDDERADGA